MKEQLIEEIKKANDNIEKLISELALNLTYLKFKRIELKELENNQSQETKTLKTLGTESKNIQMKSPRIDDVVEDRRLLTDKCLDTHSTKQELNKEILNDYSKTHCTCSDYNPKCDYCKKKDAISVKEVKV